MALLYSSLFLMHLFSQGNYSFQLCHDGRLQLRKEAKVFLSALTEATNLTCRRHYDDFGSEIDLPTENEPLQTWS